MNSLLQKNLYLFLFLFFAQNNIYSASEPIRSTQEDSEEQTSLEQALSALFGAADFVFKDFESSDNKDGGKTLNASIQLFGENNTEVSANYANARISEFELEFPEDAKLDLTLINDIVDGKLLQYIPDGLPLSAGVYINNFLVGFGDSGKTPKLLETTIGLASDWDVLGAGSFTADGVELVFSIADPTTSSLQITGELSGSATAGEIPIALSTTLSTNTEETSITGTIENLSLSSILNSFVPSDSASLLSATPDLFKSLNLSSVEFSLQPISKAMSFSANSSLGNVIMSYEKEGKSDVLIALSPAPSFQFSELSAILAPLDQMDFSGSHFILSSKQSQVPVSFFDETDTSGEDFTVRPGLNLASSISLPENMSELLGVTSVQLIGTLSDDLTRMTLESDISFDLDLGSDSGFTFDGLTAGLVVGKGDFELSFTGMGSFQAGDDRIQLFGGLNLDIISQQVGFEAGLAAGGRRLEAPINCLVEQPEWSEPFGIPGVGIRRLAIGASVGTTFPWLNELKFAGNMRIGTVSDQSNHICGALETAVNIADFSDSMIIAEVQNLTIISMIDAFVEDADIDGSLRDALETGIKSAKFKIVPKEQELFGRTYSKGVALDSARIQLLGVNAMMGFSFSESGLKAYGSMDPLVVEEGGFTFFAIKGSKDETTGPEVSLGLDAVDPHFKLDGSITVLEIQSETFIKVDKSGFEFTTTGNVLDGALTATATISASDFTETSGIYAKVAFENRLQTMVADELILFIEESTKENQETYSEAQRVLAETKGNNDFEQFWIDAAGETVTAFKEMDKAAAVAGAYVVEGLLKDAINVRKISFEGSVTSMKADVAIDIDMTIAGQHIVEQITTSINISEEALVDLIVDLIGEDVIEAFGSVGNEFVTAFEDLGTELETAFEDLGNEIVYAAEVVGEGIITGAEYIGSAFEDAAREVETFFEGSSVRHPISNGTSPNRIPPNTTHFRVTVNKVVVVDDEDGFAVLYPALDLFGGISVIPFGAINANQGATPYVYSRSERDRIEKGLNQAITINKSKDFYVDNNYLTNSGIHIISAMGEFNTFGGAGGDSEKLTGAATYNFRGNDSYSSKFRASDGDDEAIEVYYSIQQIERRGPIPTLQQMQAAVRANNASEINRLANDGGSLRGEGMIEAAIVGKASPNILNMLLSVGNYPKTSQVELALSPQYFNQDIAFALLNNGARASSDALLSVVKLNKTDLAKTLVSQYGAYPKLEHMQAAIQNNNLALVRILDAKGNIPVTERELQFALDQKDIALADSFVQRGAGVNSSMITQAVNYNEITLVKDMMKVIAPDQNTLVAAANLNDFEMFKTIASRVGLTNNQPVTIAIDNNNMDILQYALRHGGTKNEALQYALQKKNKNAVIVCLDKGANPTYALDYAVTNQDMALYKDLLSVYGADASVALQRSYDNNQFEMGKIALESGGNPDNRMSISASQGKENWVDLLLSYNANPQLGVAGAIENQHASIVKTLLEAGANGEDPHYIIKAASFQNMEIVRYLVELGGADPEMARNTAIQNNDLTMLTYLLDKGANAVGVQIPAQNGWLPMVQLLIERGDDPNRGMPKAMEFDRDEIAIYLLDKGADVKDYIKMSAERGDYSVVEKLLEKGADPDMGSFNAVRYKHTNIMKLLIENGADASKESLMDGAIWNFQYDMAKLLLENGGDTDFVTDKGETYLHRAADKKGQDGLVGLLLDYKLDPNARNKNQETPLHLAANTGNKNLASVMLLVEAGSEINALDKKSRTVLKRAKGKKVKDYLKEKGALKKMSN